MKCPKCSNSMQEIKDVDFSALKCQGCLGMWFRDDSHELAKSLEGVADLDSANEDVAATYNLVRDIDCPECNQAMMKMADRTQLHIQFEACSDCRGVFFDSGEFKDLTKFTILERLNQVIDTVKSNLN